MTLLPELFHRNCRPAAIHDALHAYLNLQTFSCILYLAGMRMHLIFATALCMLFFAKPGPAYSQCGLRSGPMNGHSSMLEATVWVQTRCAQEVKMYYWLQGDSTKLFESRPVMTSVDHGFTAHLVADQVTPGNVYEYAILIDKREVELPYQPRFVTQTLWQSRTDPPNFSFVAGSCVYVNEEAYDVPDKPYGGDYQIFEHIAQENPDMMVWLGDNIYLRRVDWNSKTGIYHRYTHTRSLPEMQQLLGQAHHYATWDDHDYGPNDCDRSFWGKETTLQAFKDFWANPNYGAGGTEGITGVFFWQDCQFFVMDDRWYRAPKDSDGDYYGEKQLQWLIDALRASYAPYKFICTGGQVVSNAEVFENMAQYPRERQMLLDSIDKYNIKGVVFLTGDRHHSEISRMVTNDGDVIYDITSSALTSKTSMHADEPNDYRVPGTMLGVRNYALISITGPSSSRICHIEFKDSDGKKLLAYTLR